jgi:phage terminase large subunit
MKKKLEFKKESNIEVIRRMILSPKFFIQVMWGLEAQQRGFPFIRNKHWTWQQDEILTAVENAVAGTGSKRISIKSGRGIGKSCVLSWIILWYLFTHKDAQVPCTAPTTDQMHDVLWKELSKWLQKMPVNIQSKFEWTNTHIRMTDSPNTWFARARTAKKESPEAFAGVHGDYVLLVADEASGIPDEIFATSEGFLTDKNVLVLLISNPTRLQGYFYDTFYEDSRNWKNMTFSAEDSPIVENDFVNRIAEKNGTDSDEYRIQVQGEFPKQDMMDEGGYVPLIVEDDLHYTSNAEFVGPVVLGIDPAGEGDDKTVWVLRDQFKTKIVAEESRSTDKSIAQKTLTLMTQYNVLGENVIIDNFGVGANVSKELALSNSRVNSWGVNVGETAYEFATYINLRAEAYFRVKKWLREKGELVNHPGWKELLDIRFRRELSGHIKIMSKRDMSKRGVSSPNYADALMMTFTRNYINNPYTKKKPEYKAHNSVTGY